MIMHRTKLLTTLLFFSLFVSACSLAKADSGSVTKQAEAPAEQASSPTASAPTQAFEPIATPTSQPTATFTLVPTPTDVPVIVDTPTATVPPCTNRATLVRHLSFPNNTSIVINNYFLKAWRIENTGTCTWTTDYKFVFASGDQMNAPTESLISQSVAPGETVDIRILMQAPNIANTYTGSWMFSDSNGMRFGFGEMGDQPIDLKLIVKNPSKEDIRMDGCG